MSSTAEELAEKFERGEVDVAPQGGKRTKSEQAEHKHPHKEGDTRKLVSNWQHGEEKRKEEAAAEK